MSPFCAKVVALLKKSPTKSLSVGELRRLLDPEKKQHQAAIARNLTMLGRTEEYVTSFLRGDRSRYLILTPKGAAS